MQRCSMLRAALPPGSCASPPCVVFLVALALFALGALLLAVTFPQRGDVDSDVDRVKLCALEGARGLSGAWEKKRWADYKYNVTIPVSISVDASLLGFDSSVTDAEKSENSSRIMRSAAESDGHGVRTLYGKLPVGALMLIPSEIDSPISWWPMLLHLSPPNSLPTGSPDSELTDGRCDCAAGRSRCECKACALLMATGKQQLPLLGLPPHQCASRLSNSSLITAALHEQSAASLVQQCDNEHMSQGDVVIQLMPQIRLAVVAVQRDTAMARVHLLYTSSALCILLMLIVLYALAKAGRRHKAGTVPTAPPRRLHGATAAGWTPLSQGDSEN